MMPEEENKSPTVTVVIPAWDEEDTIADSINSAKEQTYSVSQIIVVDDSSSDKTGEIARAAGAEVIRTPKNSGTKAQAQNYALDHIKGDLTVTIDGDTIMAKDAVEIMAKHFIEEPDLTSGCSFVIPQVRKNVWQLGRFIEYLYGLFMRKKTHEYLGVPIVCSGCLSMFRTPLIQEHKFNNRTMAEDMDLTWSLLTQHKKVRFFPGAVCYPVEPHSLKTYRGQVTRWFRAFFQNIAVHKKDLWKNKRLLGFVIWYLAEGFGAIIFYFLLFWYLIFPPNEIIVITSPITMAFPTKYIVPLFYGLSMVILAVCAFYQAHKLKLSKIDVIKGLPCFWILSFFNAFMFYEAFINEWVLKRKLNRWNKGH